jgi:hypothetical protein
MVALAADTNNAHQVWVDLVTLVVQLQQVTHKADTLVIITKDTQPQGLAELVDTSVDIEDQMVVLVS